MIELKLDEKEIKDCFNDFFIQKIQKSLNNREKSIEKQIDGFLDREFFIKSLSKLEGSLDFVFDLAFRDAFKKVSEEIGFNSLLEEAIKERLNDKGFMVELSKLKVRNLLGV